MSAVLLSILTAAVALGGLADLDSTTGAAPGAGVQVLASTHRIEFPEQIVIQLTADAPADIRSVRIYYRVGHADVRVYAYPKSFSNSGPLSAGSSYRPAGERSYRRASISSTTTSSPTQRETSLSPTGSASSFSTAGTTGSVSSSRTTRCSGTTAQNAPCGVSARTSRCE